MTKHEIESLALALRADRPQMNADYWRRKNSARIGQWRNSVDSVIGVIATFNPNFHKEGFAQWCGYHGGE